MKRILLAAYIMLALTVPGFAATAGVAHADIGDGGNVLHVSQCQNYDVYTICSAYRGESNPTATPSGNFIGEERSIMTFTVSYQGQTIDSETYATHAHVLYQDGHLQEAGYYDRFCVLFYGQGYGVVAAFHYANGVVQYSNLTVTQGC